MAARTLYRSLANVLRSLAFKQSWDNAINSVTKAINECNTNIESYVFLFLSFFFLVGIYFDVTHFVVVFAFRYQLDQDCG